MPTNITFCRFWLISISILIFSINSYSQRVADRLSMSYLSSFNIEGFGGDSNPLGISIGAMVEYSILDNLSLGIKYMRGISSTGSNARTSYDAFISDPYYLDFESKMKILNQAGVNLHFKPKLLNTRIIFGIGGAYYWNNTGYVKKFDLNHKLIQLYDFESISTLGMNASFGYEFGKLSLFYNLNFSKNLSNIEFDIINHSNISISYSILKSKYKRNLFLQNLPLITLGFGTDLLIPTNKKATAPIWNKYIQAKLYLFEKISIGYKFYPYSTKALGVDNNFDWYLNCCNWQGNYYIAWTRRNIMKNTNSKYVSLEFYSNVKNGWISYGFGLGKYHLSKVEGYTGLDFQNNQKHISAIPKSENRGVHFITGIKSGIFQSQIEYHFTGFIIPNYFSISMGIELGIPNLLKSNE